MYRAAFLLSNWLTVFLAYFSSSRSLRTTGVTKSWGNLYNYLSNSQGVSATVNHRWAPTWTLCPRCPASDIGRSYSDIGPITATIFNMFGYWSSLIPDIKNFFSNLYLFMSGPVSLSLSILVYLNVYLHVHVAWKWTWTGTWSGHGHSHRREYGYSCLAQSPLFKHSNVGYQISVNSVIRYPA
jgi:hypothetical protein